MTAIRFYQDSEQRLTGFESSGHADYADEGEDIVCAAISVLTINTVNALEQFTEDGLKLETRDGYIRLEVETPVSDAAELLLKTLALGIGEIAKQYGSTYVTQEFIRR